VRARILPFDTDEHRQAELLLPWYSTGTLEPTERARVHAHLLQCARCQADAAFQARLRAAPDPDPRVGRVDDGWAALRARLDPRPPAPPRAVTQGWQRWAHWWPVALGFQCALLAGLAIALVIAIRAPEPYRALGSGASAPMANALVVFRPDATEAQIRAALRASGARLVGGPTVTDAYLLQLPEPGPQALAGLRTQAAVLRVESLLGATAP
jgi:anti-sigma factor RsiW